ncbi:MAG: DNA-processing protein DprA [Clostridia bacterium]|jgi:DNA processing protein|nr:DNA-processing protein DprA [Clostridia bacterium]
MVYSEQDKALIWLNTFGLSLKKQNSLLAFFSSPKDLKINFNNYRSKITEIVGAETYDKISYALEDSYLKVHITGLERNGIIAVTILSKEYPSLLKNTDSPPNVLYCKGDINLLNSECIAIVGTRKCTRYGREATTLFANELSHAGFTIVSGLALGIDEIAHETTLTANGKTIAVLGGGLNEIYPALNTQLANRIFEKGLVISEYLPNEKPTNYTFPLRNRIIAGLSKGVLITEAGETSGALHTKEYANEYGRDIFVIPGNIFSSASKGTNRIIKTLQASIVTSPDDILNLYGKQKKELKPEQIMQLNFMEQIVLNIIGEDEVAYEELLNKSGLEAKKLNTLLTTMQIRGIIKKLQGNIFAK